MLEMARILTAGNYSFHYTIRFVLFSGEEQGLLGSAAYARELAEVNEQVVAMFNGTKKRKSSG